MRSVALLFVVASLWSCGGSPGDDPHAGMRAVTLPAATWQLWVPSPPFVPVESDGTHAVWRVPSSVDPLIMGGTAGGVLVMRVETVVGADPRAWLAAEVVRLRAAGARITADTRAVAGVADARSFEYAALTYDGGHRVAARALGDGHLLLITLDAPRDLADDLDVTDVIRSVESVTAADAGVRP